MAINDAVLVETLPARQTLHPITRPHIRAGLSALPSHRLALGAVLALAATLNFWALAAVGYANTYYAAAVRSMLQSWHTFFFVSFDPGGFVSIDKPPLGFWIETASAKLLGFSGFSLLLPEALAGVLAVAVLYRLVARAWGRPAGLLAALALAVTPVSVVTARNNTIDSLLVLAVLLAAWTVARAAQTGRLRWLLLGAVLVGLGFNIKMLEAYLVVPALGLTYLLGAPIGRLKRLGHLALAALVLLGVSLSWAVAVDLTPAGARPYVGSSGTNSELNLALGYNGLSRLLGGSGTPGGGGAAPGATSGAGVNLFNGGPAGLFRLLGTTLGGQVSWLLVLAVLGLLLAATRVPWRRPTERTRSLLLWGGWLLTAGAFFSVAEFFHPYYTVMLAPAIAALAGSGLVTLWREYRGGGWRGWLLPVVLLVTGGVQAYILRAYPAWSAWLTPLVLGGCGLGALVLVVARLSRRRLLRTALVAGGVAVVALLAAPTTWAAYSVANGTNATIPTAGPSAQTSGSGGGPGFGGTGGPGAGGSGFEGAGGPPAGAPGSGAAGSAPGSSGSGSAGPSGSRPSGSGGAGGAGGPGGGVDTALIRYLEAHQGTARYLVATASSQNASSIIIATGKPVMALGGFSGSDRILTVAQLEALVKNGTVRYFLLQGNGGAGGMGGNSTLTQWVSTSCTAVSSSQWQTASVTASGAGGGTTLYDCGSLATASR